MDYSDTPCLVTSFSRCVEDCCSTGRARAKLVMAESMTEANYKERKKVHIIMVYACGVSQKIKIIFLKEMTAKLMRNKNQGTG